MTTNEKQPPSNKKPRQYLIKMEIIATEKKIYVKKKTSPSCIVGTPTGNGYSTIPKIHYLRVFRIRLGWSRI
jgi:hypothetical protein